MATGGTESLPIKRQRLVAATSGGAILGLVAAIIAAERFNPGGAILTILVTALGGKALALAFIGLARGAGRSGAEGLLSAAVASFMTSGALSVVVGAKSLEWDAVFMAVLASGAGVALFALGARSYFRKGSS